MTADNTSTPTTPRPGRASRIAALPCGRRTKYVVLAFWVIVIALTGSLAGKLMGAEKNDASAYLPASAESTQELNLQSKFTVKNLNPAVVVYTLVQPQLREAMRTLCRRARLHYCDLLGQPIDAVARVSGQAAKMTPGSRPPLNSAYFKRMEAIEFAVRFDDGVAQGLHDADVVLVGVSRTSKTPLSIYLGYLGHRAANVPVVKGIESPPVLFEIDQAKVVGLTIDPNRLAEIRRARVRAMGAPARNRQYAELAEIYEELEQAEKLHRRLGCPVIDISELSIEETAHRVLRVVEERRSEMSARAAR